MTRLGRQAVRRARGPIAAGCGLALLAAWVAPAVARGAAAPRRDASRRERAEQLAASAAVLAATDTGAAVAAARRALALTQDFVPTEFVRAGRKGEVVEDAFLAARDAYRRHRAVLYRALGESLAARGEARPAVRYLRRARVLDAQAGAEPALAAALVADGRGWEALAVLTGEGAEWGAPAADVAQRAADLIGLPSLQAELDRASLAALPAERRPEVRTGPWTAPERARLSTGAPLRFDGEGLHVVYLAERSCRTCSADIEALDRAVARQATLLAVAAQDPNEDHALRQALRVYRRDWPLLLGADFAARWRVRPPAVLVVARGGWTAAIVERPFDQRLPAVLAVLGGAGVSEARPRPAWNGRPAERPDLRQQPALLREGLAPGEDQPAPPEFEQAVAAYRAGQAAEALRLFGRLEQDGSGWLLPPEARLNRALCLRRLGRGEEARRLLLKTADSRFQDAVDRALEQR